MKVILVFEDGTIRKTELSSDQIQTEVENVKDGMVTIINPETLSVLGDDGAWCEMKDL